MHGAAGPVHVHSVQIVNSVFNLFYFLFVCILIFNVYPKQSSPLHRSLTFYVFIVFFFLFILLITLTSQSINGHSSSCKVLGRSLLWAHCSS